MKERKSQPEGGGVETAVATHESREVVSHRERRGQRNRVERSQIRDRDGGCPSQDRVVKTDESDSCQDFPSRAGASRPMPRRGEESDVARRRTGEPAEEMGAFLSKVLVTKALSRRSRRLGFLLAARAPLDVN